MPKGKKKTHEDFVKEVYDLTGNEYEVLSKYINSSTKLKMKHTDCGHEYEVTPNDFFSKGSRCPKCFGIQKKDTEQFKKEVFDIIGNEYKVLGAYKNAKTKIKMKHTTCGHEYEVLPRSFTSSRTRCPKCFGTQKKNTEQFKKEVFDIVDNEYEVLGAYKNIKIKIKIKHITCGHRYDVFPNNFLLKGSRCSKCFGNKKKITEQFKKEVFDLVGNEYTVLGEYECANTKIKMRHITCGHEYDVNPSNFTNNGTRCPKCFGNQKKNTEQFEKEVFDLVGNEYTVLEEYESANTKIKMKHITCGNEYDVTPSNFTNNGTRCPKCFGTQKKNTEQFKKEVFDLVGNEYKVLGEYEGAHMKIKMVHTICVHEYEVAPSNFTNGGRCPKCSESKGEKKISEVLNSLLNINKYDFNRHYSIPDCRNKNPLPFDNFIKQGKNLLVLIEYDGIQHFEPVKWSSSMTDEEADQNLIEVQRRDLIKTDYCGEHDIPLIRIRYWEFDNIEEILIREFTLLKIINSSDDIKEVA